MIKRPKVKICCISSIEEAQIAISHGADAIGLVGPMPSGPGIISDTLIKEITSTVPSPSSTFLLTSETNPNEIIAHHKRVNTTTIQIVDAIDKENYKAIRKKLPLVKLVQVIHVIDNKSVDAAIDISPYVDAILLDSGNPNLSVKELGGTGRTHNWFLSKEIRESISTPVYLAGGLNKDNIHEAIETVQPHGVDVCSGVRTDGRLDLQKLSAFFRAMES